METLTANEIDQNERPPEDWAALYTEGDVTTDRTCKGCGGGYKFVINDDLRAMCNGNINSIFFKGTGYCTPCDEKRQREYEQRQIEEAKAHRAYEWRITCPPLYADSDPALLPASAKKNMDRVLGWNFNPKGLILAGPSGQGKTRLQRMLAKRLFVEEGRTVEMFDAVSFSHQCIKLAMESRLFEAWISKAYRADVLFFDDFGKIKFSERVEAEMFGIIENRMAWRRPIILSTNDDAASLKQRLSADRGEPMLRRLKESNELITF